MRIKTRVTDLTTRKELPVCILGDLHGTNAVMLLGEQSKGHVIANLRNAHNVTSNLSGVQVRLHAKCFQRKDSVSTMRQLCTLSHAR